MEQCIMRRNYCSPTRDTDDAIDFPLTTRGNLNMPSGTGIWIIRSQDEVDSVMVHVVQPTFYNAFYP